MDDLISRSALIRDVEAKEIVVHSNEHPYDVMRKQGKAFRECVENAPAVDAVEIVRCKDCDCWNEEYTAGRASLGNLVCMCQEWSDVEGGRYCYTRPNDFCSRGERKENESHKL